MSSHSPSTPGDHGHGHDGAAHHTNYVAVWGVLMVLFVISVTGPLLEIRVITLLTAFGIAVVKAYIVAKYFMHLNIEKRFVVYLLTVCLGLMVLFFIAVTPDVLKHYGMNWVNRGAENRPAPVLHHEAGAAAPHAPAGEHAAPAAEGAAPADAAPAKAH